MKTLHTRSASLVGLVAAASLLVGCGAGDEPGNGPAAGGDQEPTATPSPEQDTAAPPAGMCAAELVFRGATYTMTDQTPVERQGRSLGEATVPVCDDTPGTDLEEGAQDDAGVVEVFALPGVPADQAVLSGGSVWTATP